MAFSVYEYRRPQGWSSNVLALALAIYEVACQSTGRICYAIASLCLAWSMDLIREMSPLNHVKELLVLTKLCCTWRTANDEIIFQLYLGLVASHAYGGISVNVPIKLCEGSVEYARLYIEQFAAPGVFIAMALKYDRFKRATGRSSESLS
jgi:hypothetical protein